MKKKLLINLPRDKAPVNFTTEVMGKVFEIAKEEFVQEAYLEQILLQQKNTTAPKNFSIEVMQSLSAPQIEKPIISKWGWAAIILVTLCVSFYLAIVVKPFKVNYFDVDFSGISLVYPISLFSLGLLVYMDYVLRNKKSLKI